MTENIQVFTRNSIRVEGKSIIYIDPFQMRSEPHDADLILITHEHYDHFSPEDIAKVTKPGTRMVVPEKMKAQAEEVVAEGGKLYTVTPGMLKEMGDLLIETVPAYNNLKPYHPKKNGWVGYILHVNGKKIYIAGDTDMTKENQKVSCDIALVPIGGTYTMDAAKAAELINMIRPDVAIPTHYDKDQDAEEFQANVRKSVKVEIKKQY
ncbi:MAG: MBL fold metallo-hydrolase [Lachnospiraceae bacterium]|nr:MBL fold metallo-hydrolase [Lachnospiraceae bacterium]